MVKKDSPTPEKKLLNSEQDKQTILDLLSTYTKHKHVKLVQRGNAAIFAALYIAKKMNSKPFILIPDQGGWLSFKTYPKILGFDTRVVKTNRGLIDLIDLEKKAESGAALLVTSFAGYFADQPMSYISNICRKYNCLLIEDASGAVGDEDLCDGDYADIIVASFGKWKPINAEYGGFISTNKKEFFESAGDIFSTTNHYPRYDILLEKLKGARQRMKVMLQKAKDVKKDLSERLPHLKILHQDLRGLNVVVKYMDKKEQDALEGYCKANGYGYVQCPQYTRIEEDAMSIELKRLDSAGG
ncbi:MAG: DegT/DnrJ/EryC1/StrS family aminotransferase [Candidatus Woesearchaeota archaeon]